MKLSPFERTVLINQYEILKALYPARAEEFDEMLQILNEGFVSQYHKTIRGYGDEVSEESGSYVMDVLDMYECLQDSAKRADLEDARLTFPGFDGNNESGELGYARFLRDVQGRWTEVRVASPDMNSHHRTSDRYGAMLAVFRPMYKDAMNSSTYLLTADQVESVLGAR